jgi:DNA-directed RNA polymerase subunit RPC12/RpoP
MKTVTYICNRCGNAIKEGRATIDVKTGPLARRLDETVDLCPDCAERFDDFLRSGRDESAVMLEVDSTK